MCYPWIAPELGLDPLRAKQVDRPEVWIAGCAIKCGTYELSLNSKMEEVISRKIYIENC